MAIFRGEPPNWPGASNGRGIKNHDFQPMIRFVSEIMQDRAIVTMQGK